MQNKNEYAKSPYVVRAVDGRHHIVYFHNNRRCVSVICFVSRESAEKWLRQYVQAKANKIAVMA